MSTINVTNLSGRGGATPNLPDGANITGVATATTFSGTLDGSLKTTGTPTLGLGVTINASGISISGVATAGILSATTLYGDGSNLAGVGETIAPWNYNPDVNDALVTPDTGIGITFSKKVVAGSGTATLKIVNAGAAGTTIQSWGVSSCTFATQQFTLGALVSPLTINKTYQLDIPGTFIDDNDGNSYVGTAYTFATMAAADKLWAWGSAAYGGLAQNSTTRYSSPIQIPGTNWKDSWGSNGNGFGVTNFHQLILKTDGTLWTWGFGNKGQLSQNNTAQYSSPVQIPGTTWASTSRGYYNSFATKTDGTLWAWGYNDTGNLGQNNVTQYSSPVQIPGTTWTGEIGGGIRQSYGIKTDGTLWTWGSNDNGGLGLNNTTTYSSPVQIPGTTWSKAVASYYASAAIKTDNTLWTWGDNEYGELGQNNKTKYSSPTQIPGTWSSVEKGREFSVAINTDGELFAWGYNSYGNLGLNNRTRYSSPTQIPGTTWNEVSCGRYHTLALKTNGTMWAWGDNEEGELGQNESTGTGGRKSSPVQVGSSTEWTAISCTTQGSYAIEKDTTP